MVFDSVIDQIILFSSISLNLIFIVFLVLSKKMNISIRDIIKRPFRERSKFILIVIITIQSISFFLVFIFPGLLIFTDQIESYPSGTSWDISAFGEDSINDILQMFNLFIPIIALSVLAIIVYLLFPVFSAIIAKDRFYYYKTMKYGLYSSVMVLMLLGVILTIPFSSIPDSVKVSVNVGSTEWENMKIPIILNGIAVFMIIGYIFSIFITLGIYFIFLKRMIIRLPIFFTGKPIKSIGQKWFEIKQSSFKELEISDIFIEEFLGFSILLENSIKQYISESIKYDKTNIEILEYSISLGLESCGYLFIHERIPIITFNVSKAEQNKYLCGLIGFWESYNDCTFDEHLLRKFDSFSEILKEKGFIQTEFSPLKEIWENEHKKFYSKGYSPFLTQLKRVIRRNPKYLDRQSSAKFILQKSIPETDLLDMLEQKYLEEEEYIEFKDKLPSSMHDISKKICALANTHSGAIFIGVEDNGKIIGCDVEKTMQRIAGICEKALHPRVNPTYRILRKNAIIRVVLVIIPCTKQVIRTKNIAYIMEGRTVGKLTFEEEKSLELEKNKIKFRYEVIDYLIEKHKQSKKIKFSKQ